MCVLSRFSGVQLFATPCIVAGWLSCPWDFPGKNIGLGCHSLPQGSFPTQGSIKTVPLGLLHLPHRPRGSLPLVLPSTPFSLLVCVCVLSRSEVPDSWPPHRLWSAMFLCLWGFSRQNHWSGLSCPPPGDLPNPGMEPRSPASKVDSLPSEPPGKSLIDIKTSCYRGKLVLKASGSFIIL